MSLTSTTFLATIDFQSLTGLAYQYGPFFFSLIFLFSILRWAWSKWQVALAIPSESSDRVSAIRTTRNVYISSFIIGVLLVVASCIWWWKFRPTRYVFAGKIAAIHSYEQVSFPYMYRKEEERPDILGEPDHLRDERFVFVQDKPFQPGQKFEIDFMKPGNPDVSKLNIVYGSANDDELSYSIDYDTTTKKNEIKQEARTIGPLGGFFEPKSVFAQTTSLIDPAKQDQESSSKGGPVSPSADSDDIHSLQDGRIGVGVKLRLLQLLAERTNMNNAQDLLFSQSGSEPLIVTVLDLSRYSDPEVAAQAADYLKRINVSNLVVQALTSSDQSRKAMGETAFMHLSDTSANIVLDWLSSLKSSEVDVLREKGNPLQLVGTYSPQGDRYYLAVTWNKLNSSSVGCLTHLFNKEFDNSRTLDQESRLMVTMNQRMAYSYNKAWDYWMRPQIIECGGSIRFVNPVIALSVKS